MGQKTHPIGLRVGVTKDWRSKWYADKKEFGTLLSEDRKIRDLLKNRLEGAAITDLRIERHMGRCRITIHTARPGVVIGRRGAEIEKIKEDLSRLTNKEIHVDIQEVRQPDANAQLVAENIAMQFERRIAFRRAMKKAVQIAMEQGVEGIRVRAGGRLGGAELARVEQYLQGRVPLHTLRANIEYGFAEARTKQGIIGVKCWICKGEEAPQRGGAEVIETGSVPRTAGA